MYYLKKNLYGLALFLFLCIASVRYAAADELTPVTGTSGNVITITAKEGSEIGAVYIKWNKPIVPYLLETADCVLECGQDGFLHDYIPLTTGSSTITITFPDRSSTIPIKEIRIFDSTDNIPSDVQMWEPSCEKADILLVSAHADDEILFMGGVIPTYCAEQGASVQVVYMAEFWSSAPVREHEKLDGLWVDGLRTYPVCGNFYDKYAKDKAAAMQIYDLQEMTDYLTDVIRKFQPQIVVTHDFNGEYGHGFHQLTAEAVSLAIVAAADDTVRTDTDVYAEKGSWSVSKAYFHLYKDNPLHIDMNVPLESMNGQTALEVAKNAYLQHVSQQWCWFYVSDTYEYSVADFGLYYTSVGYDTNNSMLDNIVTCAEQERLRIEEEERIARELAEKEEQERLEAERLEKERIEAERIRLEEEEAARIAEEQRLAAEAAKKKTLTTAGIIVGVAVILTVLFIVILKKKRR